MSKVLDKLSKHFPTSAPTASGPNVFTSSDYAKDVGLGISAANVRLRKLLDQGVLRRVRVKRSNYSVLAYEYIGKG